MNRLRVSVCLGTAVLLAASCSSSDPEGAGSGADGKEAAPVLEVDAGGTGQPLAAGEDLVELPAGGLDALRDSACMGWSAAPEPLPSVLEVVVDVSGTMGSDAPGTNDSKWEVTRDALRAAIVALPANTSLGLSFYPNTDNGGSSEEAYDRTPCIDTGDNVPIGLLGGADSAQREALERALDSVEVNPQGATPTHDAILVALDELAAVDYQSTRFVLLITDGQPTLREGCYGLADPRQPEDERPIIEEIADARSGGVSTFVIGSPGSESNNGTGEDVRYWLSEAAREGGTAPPGCSDDGPNYCHLDMTEEPDFGVGLQRALSTVAGAIISCNYTVPAPPPDQEIDPDAVNVVYTDGAGSEFLIRRNAAADCDRGWHYTADGTEVELCGETCDLVMGEGGARLELMFGCAAEFIPVE